ncbi:glucose-6-phosphate isomerase-like protein [Lates japonicus]|uniref:Glucose-6-phosphate isomerase-like protein n=1 Tax=Lates japonicus TaxID=270547 RepID=A0AAD3RIR9_LATJO|nr:glucose-6-phosphate isomerase-like protein [Lates japonicus]
MRDMFDGDKDRFSSFSTTLETDDGDILLDYSKNLINQEVMSMLLAMVTDKDRVCLQDKDRVPPPSQDKVTALASPQCKDRLPSLSKDRVWFPQCKETEFTSLRIDRVCLSPRRIKTESAPPSQDKDRVCSPSVKDRALSSQDKRQSSAPLLTVQYGVLPPLRIKTESASPRISTESASSQDKDRVHLPG